MNIVGLMACTKNGVIGLNGKIPWRYPDELKHFQDTTYNQTIIMGRKTFDEMSQLKLLKNRNSIVFTRNKILPINPVQNVTFVHSLKEFTNLQLTNKKEIYMIGGGEIARLFLENNLIKQFILTRIHKEYDGDTYFPLSMIAQWDVTTTTKNKDYTIVNYIEFGSS